MKHCAISDCRAKYSCKGYCIRHYYYLKRHGVPETEETRRRWEVRGQGFINMYGYRTLWKNGRKILEHRWVLEQKLGRKLKQSEHIHHLNGNKLDNRIENLKIVTNEEHGHEHRDRYIDGFKVCSKCKKKKSLDNFVYRVNSNSKSRHRFYYSWCKKCSYEEHKTYREKRRKAGLSVI